MARYEYHGSYEEEQEGKQVLDSRLIRWLYRYLRPYRYLFLFGILMLLISKAIEAYIPIFIGKVTHEALFVSEKFYEVLRGCAQILGLLVLVYFLDAVNVGLKSWGGNKALLQLRTDVYRHFQSLPVRYYDRHAVGKMMTRTIQDVDQINQMFAESLIPLIGNMMLFVCIYAGIFFIDWRLGLLITAILPVVFLLTNHFRLHQRICYDRIRAIVAAMNTFVQEHLMGVSTIQSFGLQEKEFERFSKVNEDHKHAYIDTIHYFALFFAGIDFIQSVTLIGVFLILVAYAPAEQGFQAGTFFTLSLYALMLFRPLSDLADRYNVLQSAMAAASRLFHTLELPPERDLETAKAHLEEIKSIVFEGVWFAYQNEEWVLKGLTFEMQKGQSIALVGVTGAGKTTIANLLLRFYDYQKGSIKINGIELREIPMLELRKHFSIVLQDPEIFSGTIAENIGLYQPEITEGRIQSVMDHLDLGSFIRRFSDGIHHQLTERGKSLSAGERQLISMARAAAHHRSVLMLDEATANIDTGTERKIQRALHKILQGKTAIVIAHRLSTIQDVTRILVLHHGVVAESGSHRELLELKGIYEKLYRLQFLNQ